MSLTPDGPPDRRAQSETIGYVLLLGIGFVSLTAVIAFGSVAVNDTKDAMSASQAELAMEKFDAEASKVALGGGEMKTVTIKSGAANGDVYFANRGWMKIEIKEADDASVNGVVTNRTLGTLVYDVGDEEIAYQGGGVWRYGNGRSEMVSPPEFHFKGQTLTLPMVVVDAKGEMGGRVTLEQNGSAEQIYPNSSAGYTNPLGGGSIFVTVGSKYYEAWGRFFETRTEGDVTYNHAKNQVTIELVVPDGGGKVKGAVVSGASGETITIGNQPLVDSYDSRDGPYSTSSAGNATIAAAGKVKLQNQAEVEGNIVTASTVVLQNQAEVDGNVSYGGSPPTLKGKAEITGWVAGNGSVPTITPMDSTIDNKSDHLEHADNNSNDLEDDILDNANNLNPIPGQNSSDTEHWVVESNGDAEYYVKGFTLQKDHNLTFDTSGGDITIVVDGDLTVQDGADIFVTGPGRVNIYLDGQLTVQGGGAGTIKTSQDRTPLLWIFMDQDSQVSFQNKAVFQGVVYGPGSPGTRGVQITLQNQAEVYGGLVGYTQTIQNKGALHFDEALLGTSAFPSGNQPNVQYLHISVNRINVSS